MRYRSTSTEFMRAPLPLRDLLLADPFALNQVLFGRSCVNNFVFGALLLPDGGGWRVMLLVDQRQAWDLAQDSPARLRLLKLLQPLGLPIEVVQFSLAQRNAGDYPTEFLDALVAPDCHLYSRQDDDCVWCRVFDAVCDSRLRPGCSEPVKLLALGCAAKTYVDGVRELLAQLRASPQEPLPRLRGCLSIVRSSLRYKRFFSRWEHIAVVA